MLFFECIKEKVFDHSHKVINIFKTSSLLSYLVCILKIQLISAKVNQEREGIAENESLTFVFRKWI